MNSRSHGALKVQIRFEEKAIVLINDFFGALVDLFPEAWFGQTPRTSRMKHSAGITALGFVMEIAYAVHGANRSIHRGPFYFERKRRLCLDWWNLVF